MAEQKIDYQTLKKDFLIVNGTVGLAFFLMVFFVLLQQIEIMPSFPCLFHEIVRMYCPGCGGTRAAKALLKGDVLSSLWCNPSLLIGILLASYYEIGVIVTLIKKNGKKYYIAKGWPAYVFVAFVILFAIVRDVLLVVCKFDMLGDFIS